MSVTWCFDSILNDAKAAFHSPNRSNLQFNHIGINSTFSRWWWTHCFCWRFLFRDKRIWRKAQRILNVRSLVDDLDEKMKTCTTWPGIYVVKQRISWPMTREKKRNSLVQKKAKKKEKENKTCDQCRRCARIDRTNGCCCCVYIYIYLVRSISPFFSLVYIFICLLLSCWQENISMCSKTWKLEGKLSNDSKRSTINKFSCSSVAVSLNADVALRWFFSIVRCRTSLLFLPDALIDRWAAMTVWSSISLSLSPSSRLH